MSAQPRNAHLAAYHSISVRGGVDNADPHGMVLMLMDAALQRIAIARGCIERGEIARKAKLLHSCVTIVAELRGCLNLAQGGPLAQNLNDLYDYMIRRLLHANLNSDVAALAEVLSLMGDIRSAWVAIGPQVRRSPAVAPSGSWNGAAGASSTANTTSGNSSA